MTTGDYWFTHVYKSQTAERIGAAEQERLAGEARSVYRQQQLAARLRRHEVKLTASKPADIVEVASWASSPTEVIEWLRRRLELATDRRPDGGPARKTAFWAVLRLERAGVRPPGRFRCSSRSTRRQGRRAKPSAGEKTSPRCRNSSRGRTPAGSTCVR
jgi:hypothetical protein